MQKICSNNCLEDEMGIDNDKVQTIKKDDEIVLSSAQKRPQSEDGRPTITGRPNIDEISKRNEEAERREKKSFYTVTGIIVLFIVVVVVLIYFFI